MLQRIAGVSSLAWVDHLTLVRIEQQQVLLAPQPGYEDAARFANNPSRTERLRNELADLLGRRVRIVVQQAVDESPPAANAEQEPAVSTTQQSLQAALDLPLVREVMEAFPDARPVNVRPESPT